MRKTLGNFNACPSVFWQKITVPCPDSSNGIGHYARPKAYEMSIADCSPFGVQLDGRTVSAERYRYGFNGMEKDDEMKGAGNSYDFGARILDPRLGRWLSRDPLAAKQPAWSPYKAFFDCPLIFIDPKGETEFQINIVINAGEKKGYATVTTAPKVITDGCLRRVDGMGNTYHNEQDYYDYQTITVTTVHKDGTTSVEKYTEILYDNGPQVSKDVWFIRYSEGSTRHHKDKESDYGVRRSFGFDIKGDKDGKVSKDYSHRVFGSIDKSLLDYIFKSPKFKPKYTYKPGKGSWHTMKDADIQKWVKWANDCLQNGGKVGDGLKKTRDKLREASDSKTVKKHTMKPGETRTTTIKTEDGGTLSQKDSCTSERNGGGCLIIVPVKTTTTKPK